MAWPHVVLVCALSLACDGCGARSGLLDQTRDSASDAAPDTAPDAAVDAAPDAAPECQQDTDCDDDVFCNGDETCLDGACLPGVPLECPEEKPCRTGTCDEKTRSCVTTELDRDLDGHLPILCGGDDCNDDDPRVFLGAKEICDYIDDDCDGEIDEALAYEGLGGTLDLSSSVGGGRRPVIWFDGDFDVAFDTYPGGPSQVFYVAVTSDGTSATVPSQRTFSDVLSTDAALLRVGDEYALFSHFHQMEENRGAIAVLRLDAGGAQIAGAVPFTSDDPDADMPAAAWSGEEHGVGYITNIGDEHAVRFVRIGPDGALRSAGIRVSDGGSNQRRPGVAWTGEAFAIAYAEHGGISVSFVDPLRDEVTWTTRVSDDGEGEPVLLWTGGELALAWGTGPSIGASLRFARLDDTGAIVSERTLVRNVQAFGVSLIWTGREYAIGYQDFDGTSFVRVGRGERWTSPPGLVDLDRSDVDLTVVAWNGTQYGMAYGTGPDRRESVVFQLVGCP